MTSFENLLSQAIVQRFGWTLLHFVWQGAAVAALLAAGLWFLRRRSADARYVACCSALLLMAALPVGTFLTVDPAENVDARASVGRDALPSDVERHSRPTGDSLVGTAADSLAPALPGDPAASAPLSGTTEAPIRTTPFRSEIARLVAKLEPLLPWCVAIWATGVVILSLRLFGGWVQLQFLKRRAVAPVADRLQQAAVRLSKQLRLHRTARLLESAVVQVPMVIGWLRPVILLPVSAVTRLPVDQLEALLAHELAHIGRYDYLVNMIQTVIETLLFYHPAVWWVSRRIRAEREHCCDDLAVSVCGDSLLYARALTELEQVRGVEPELAVAADTGDLLARVRRITGLPVNRTRRPRPGLAGVVVMLAVVATITGVFGHARQQAPNAPPTALNIDVGDVEARVADAANDEEAAVLCERLLGDFERAKSHLLRRWEQVQTAKVSHPKWIVAVRLARCSAHLGEFEDVDVWLKRSVEIDPSRRHRPIEEEIALCRKWVPIRENHRKAYIANPSLASARELFRAHGQLAEYASTRQLAAEMHSRFGRDRWLASQEFQSACQFLASYYASPVAPEAEEPEAVPARDPQVEAVFEELRANRRKLVQFTKAKWERMTTVEKARALIGVSQQPQAFYQKQGQKEPRKLTEREAVAILTNRGFTAQGRARNANAARRFNEQIQHIATQEERAPFEAEEVAIIDELANMGEAALDDLFRKLEGSFEGLWAQNALAQMAEAAVPALTREIETTCELARREGLQHEHRIRMNRLVRALASEPSPTAIPGLRLALDYAEAHICREALSALVRIPDGLTQDILLRLWEHENLDVRGSAASLLGERGDDKAIKVFQRDIPTAYGEARYEAEHAIWRIRGRLGLERGEEPEQVRRKKGDDPRVWEGIDKSINSPNRGIRITVINRFDYGTPNAESLEPLMGLMQTDPDGGVRLRATQVYARIFGRSVNEAAARGEDVAQFSAGFDALADIIDKGDQDAVRAALAAVRCFRNFETRPGYDAIVKRVLEGLSSQSIAHRSTCMSAFVGLFSRDGERLNRVLLPDRRQAAERAVLSGLSSDYGRYWVDATTGAQMLGFTDATPALVRLLESGDWHRRRTAAVALGEIGDDRAIPTLEQMAYTDPYVDHNGLYANRETAWQAAQAIRQRTGGLLPKTRP